MKTFRINDKDIDEFIEIYKKEFKKDISRTDAYENAQKLITLMHAAYSGMAGTEDYKIIDHKIIDGVDYIHYSVPREQYQTNLTKKMKKVFDHDEMQVRHFREGLKQIDNQLKGVSILEEEIRMLAKKIYVPSQES